MSEKSWHGNNWNPSLFLCSGWPPCQPRNLFLSKPRVCIVGSPLNSHPSWLVTRLSAAPPLPSGGTITPDLEALYLNHITRPCVFYFPFEVTGVRHLSGPVWVHFPLSHHILISWSDFLCMCVRARLCVWERESVIGSVYLWEGLFVSWGWLTGWWEDNTLRTTNERSWNSVIVTIMNLKENPCVCSLAIEARWDALQTLSAPDVPHWRILQHLSPSWLGAL